MRSLGFIVFALALTASGCQPAMQDFTSQQHGFKARFPGSPKEQSQPGPMGIQMTMYMVESKNGVIGVAVADMPIPERESDAEIQARLDGSRDGALQNVGGSLKSSTAITLNGKYPGREFTGTITKPTTGQMRAKIFLVNKRLYQVLVMGTDSYANSANATEFLNSFQLTQ